MLNWIGSNPLGKPAEEMVKRLSADSTVAVNALSTIARDGLVAVNALESYVETDEDVGPRVSVFELNEKQLSAIGREFTAMRDAASGMQAANLQLAKLDGMDESRTRTLACVRVLAESQRTSAQVSQQLATHYDRFVSVVLNPLQGAAAVVQEKYASYCNTVIESRRQKSQLQVLLRQKERAELRSLERTLIPSASKGAQGDNAFATDMEGNLAARSPTTLLWWSGYARLDTQRKVLLLLSKQADPPSAASRAVALSKYTLAHELPEHFAKRAAAFELVPHDPELPVVVLASDGSMASRRWVAALQEAIDYLPEDEEPPQESHASPGVGTPPQPQQPPPPAAGTPLPLQRQMEQLVVFGSAKADEFDRKLSGTLAQHAQKSEAQQRRSNPNPEPEPEPFPLTTDPNPNPSPDSYPCPAQAQLAQLARDRQALADDVTAALDGFHGSLGDTLTGELLRLAEGQHAYHQAMAEESARLCRALRALPREPQPAAAQPQTAAPAAPTAPTAPAAPAAPSAPSAEIVEAKAPSGVPLEAPTSAAGTAGAASAVSAVGAVGAAGAACGALGPAWTRGEIEAPQGEKSMGSWTAAIYTSEQQARLGIDEDGQPATPPPLPSSEAAAPPPPPPPQAAPPPPPADTAPTAAVTPVAQEEPAAAQEESDDEIVE